MNKYDRQGAILRLVQERAIATQGEVVEELRERGIDAVQTTVSRDIHQLGLVKTRATTAGFMHCPERRHRPAGTRSTAALRRWALSIEPTETLVVVKTARRATRRRSRMHIDSAVLADVAGTVAGENTIFVAPREGTTAAETSPSSSAITSKETAREAGPRSSPSAAGSTRAASCRGCREDYDFDEVVAVLVDVGQVFDLDASIARGQAAGAAEVLLVDRQETFASDQVAKALKANALYEGRYPLVSALSRPVIAAAVADVALELDAEAVVHGCTGKGNDQLRFELAFRANYPGVTSSRRCAIGSGHGTRRSTTRSHRGSRWRRPQRRRTRSTRTSSDDRSSAASSRIRGRSLPSEPYELTADPRTAPEPEEVVVTFERGLPAAVDGEELPLHELVERAERPRRRLMASAAST